jgi:hypothetical protein
MSEERDPQARAKAARSVLGAAGLIVIEVDEHVWEVRAKADDAPFLFWPASSLWRRPDGTSGGGGARTLALEIRNRGGNSV